MAFSFCLVLWQAPPSRYRRGDFSFPAAGNCQTKKHTFFHGRGEGQHKHKNRTYKNNGAMMVIKHSISSALVFRTLGRNGALVFFAAFRRRLFHLYLFFHSNASPGFFIFPCFLQGSAGGKSGARTPCQQSLLWEYHPRFRPPDAPKNKWKNDGMTGKNKCPKPPKKQAPALLVKLRRSAGNRPGPIPFGLLTSHTSPCPPFPWPAASCLGQRTSSQRSPHSVHSEQRPCLESPSQKAA